MARILPCRTMLPYLGKHQHHRLQLLRWSRGTPERCRAGQHMAAGQGCTSARSRLTMHAEEESGHAQPCTRGEPSHSRTV